MAMFTNATRGKDSATIRFRTRLTRTIAAVALAAIGVFIASQAVAATATWSDTGMTSTSWKHYTTTRTSTQSTISFDPANSEADGSLLYQAGGQYALNLKLRHL